MAQSRTLDYIGGTTSTVNGSSAIILSSTPPNDVNSLVLLHVLATTSITDDRAIWFRVGFVHKSSAGVITVDQQTDVAPSFATDPIKHSDIDVIISGGTIQLQVTGDPGYAGTILWEAYARIFRS